MNTKALLIIAGLLVTGGLQAQVLYSANGFESHSAGAISGTDPSGTGSWVEWDSGGNNAHPGWTSVQTDVANNGSQALGISDENTRVITRLYNVVATNALMYWEASYKSEATNDFGIATITLRSAVGNIQFNYNILEDGKAHWYQASDNTLRTVETAFGDWHDIRIVTNFDTEIYKFFLGGVEAFSGSIPAGITSITSWEVDGTYTDAARSPQGSYVFYIDDLEIGIAPADLVIFSAAGFENPPYALGPVTDVNPPGNPIWIQWDADGGNNSSPEYTTVQSNVVNNGSQALGIADTTNRVISRVAQLDITNSLTYYEASLTSTATNDFGIARITLRFDSGTKTFIYNPLDGLPRWYDANDNSKQSPEAPYGQWHQVRVEADLAGHTYRFLVNGTEEFAGTFDGAATQINSWEIDVDPSDAGRDPSGQYAFYIDDLTIGIPEEIPAGYEGWISQYPAVGSETNKTDNPDNDTLNNLYEWGLGGRPDDPNDIGEVPSFDIVQDGGSWLEYVHVRRNDFASIGLTYYLEQNTDLLVAGAWASNNYEVGVGVLDAEFDAVTNRLSTDVENEQFLRLIIESN